jgi:hypothetical protein
LIRVSHITGLTVNAIGEVELQFPTLTKALGPELDRARSLPGGCNPVPGHLLRDLETLRLAESVDENTIFPGALDVNIVPKIGPADELIAGINLILGPDFIPRDHPSQGRNTRRCDFNPVA